MQRFSVHGDELRHLVTLHLAEFSWLDTSVMCSKDIFGPLRIIALNFEGKDDHWGGLVRPEDEEHKEDERPNPKPNSDAPSKFGIPCSIMRVN